MATTLNLADTLPSTVVRGGVFSVSAAGSPLPAGITLQASGLLSVSATAVVGSTSNVEFVYAEP